MNNLKIDFVVTWLDSSDASWQEQFSLYKGKNLKGDKSKTRYRDWELFKYWFRAVEKYAPWVNKIYLITNGKFPDWINTNSPKLVLVKHSDYIPQQFLPTFNSRTIEFYMNRINGLSDYFVYFNDDMFLNAPVEPQYYFRNGLPCDSNAENIFNTVKYNAIDRFNIKIGLFTNVSVVNGHFDRKDVIKGSFKNWYGFHLSLTDRVMSFIISLDPFHRFVGFRDRHFEQPYLKSTFDDAWEKEAKMLTESSTRFREDATLTPYFFRYWQFATNRFYPVRLSHGTKIPIRPENLEKIKKAFANKKIYSLCLNDNHYCTEEGYELSKPFLLNLFENKFPNKSQFEK